MTIWVINTMRKVIKISTNLFDLHIKWNGALASIEGAILIGTFFLKLFSDNPAVDRLCVIILLFNALALVVSVLIGMKVTVEDETVSMKGTMDTTVEKRAVVNEKAPVPKSSGTREIRNKVPVPNKPKSEPVMEDAKVETSSAESESASVKTLDQMTEQDWEALFKMD